MKRMLVSAALIGTIALTGAFALAAGPVLAGSSGTSSGGSFDSQASQIVTEIAAGQFAAVRAQFDSTMTDKVSETDMSSAWSSYQQALGNFQSAGQPTSVVRGDLTVEQVPIQLAQGSGEVRVTFHPDGTIAGLYFLPSGVPVPDQAAALRPQV